MTESLQTIKDIATIAAPLTGAIIETWVKPKLVILHKYLKIDKAVFENALSTKFDEYLRRTYEKLSFINVLVFQNQQKKLEEIYIPLTVQKVQGATHILINGYKSNFLPEHKRVLIRDTAGMGKSTLLKFLFLSCITSNKGIPIFIELRKVGIDESILKYICNELNPLDDEFDKDFILKLIKQGDFVFFLDGYDEIPFSQRDVVTRNLQDFISKASNNLFILSSRPDSSLASFQSFQEFNIQPLKMKEAFRLLKRYDRGGELSTEIIKKLNEGLLENLREFLANPFLVSLLFKSYEYKRTIPFRKHVFYRQVYDALFESHDLTKGGPFIREKHSKLDSEGFHKVLRALGFITVKLGQIEFDKDKILALLREAKADCGGFDFNEASLLKDLIVTVPLFNSEGNYYKWSHKSIQEYFAAQFICVDAKTSQNAILRKIADGTNITKYFNVVDLCYDIDYDSFRQTIIYDLLTKFLTHYDNGKQGFDRQVSKELINERKALTFASVNVVMVRNLAYASVLIALRARDFVRAKGINIDQYFYDAEYGRLLLSFTKEEEVIVKFLGNKGEDITERVKNERYQYDDDEDLYTMPDRYSKEKQTVRENLVNVKEDFCLVDENSKSTLNHPDLFAIVNLLLKLGHAFVLNAPKCRQLKREIEEAVRKRRSDSLLRGI
jgi:hypothetical protein